MSQNINSSANLENALELSSTSPETNDSVDLPLNPVGYEIDNILFHGKSKAELTKFIAFQRFTDRLPNNHIF
jgi:hypothetical protein